MKFYIGDNEGKQSHSWKFGCCPLTLRNLKLLITAVKIFLKKDWGEQNTSIKQKYWNASILPRFVQGY